MALALQHLGVLAILVLGTNGNVRVSRQYDAFPTTSIRFTIPSIGGSNGAGALFGGDGAGALNIKDLINMLLAAQAQGGGGAGGGIDIGGSDLGIGLENPFGTGEPSNEPEFPVAGKDYHEVALEEHNKYRAMHGAGPLTLDPQLSRECEHYAQILAQKNKMEHSKGDYGENLWMMSGVILDPAESAKRAVQSWYDEVKKYRFNNPGFTMGTGHFTQVVWKGSRKLGIGLASNQATQSAYVVARYTPPGNYQGMFPENVSPKMF